MSQVAAALDIFDLPIDMSETARTFGVSMTALEQLAREQAASAVHRVA